MFNQPDNSFAIQSKMFLSRIARRLDKTIWSNIDLWIEHAKNTHREPRLRFSSSVSGSICSEKIASFSFIFGNWAEKRTIHWLRQASPRQAKKQRNLEQMLWNAYHREILFSWGVAFNLYTTGIHCNIAIVSIIAHSSQTDRVLEEEEAKFSIELKIVLFFFYK